MENGYPEYVTKSAIDGLVKKVKLPAPDEFTQDWEYEVSDSSRIPNSYMTMKISN